MNKNIYLLFGEEKHFIEEDIKKIVASFSNDTVTYDMLEDNISDALDDLMTMSIFGDKKIVICKNCTFLTGSPSEITHDIEKLNRIINNDIDNILILVVYNDKLDDRKKIVKELKKRVVVRIFNKLNKNEMMDFIINEFKKDKYIISRDNSKLFIDIVGDNMDIINSEIIKMKLYKSDDKNITESDIKDTCYKMINDNIFDFVDAIIKRDLEKAITLYDDLLILNEEPIKLIAIIGNQFRLIYQTKSMYKSGYSEFDISKHLGVHPYRVKLANEIRIDEHSILTYLYKLADLDINIKTGLVDKNVAFEMFLFEI